MPIRVNPLLVKFLARLGIEAQERAVLAAQIDQAVIDQRRRDVRRVAGAGPEMPFRFLRDVPRPAGSIASTGPFFADGTMISPGTATGEATNAVSVIVARRIQPAAAEYLRAVGSRWAMMQSRRASTRKHAPRRDRASARHTTLGTLAGHRSFEPDARFHYPWRRPTPKPSRCRYAVTASTTGHRPGPASMQCRTECRTCHTCLAGCIAKLFAIDRIAGQFPRPHEGPHVAAVGRWRRRGEVAFIAAYAAIVPEISRFQSSLPSVLTDINTSESFSAGLLTGSELSAEVKKICLPHTTGVDPAGPGSGNCHSTPFSSLQVVGKSVSWLMPSKWVPRHCGQLLPPADSVGRTSAARAAISITLAATAPIRINPMPVVKTVLKVATPRTPTKFMNHPW